MQGKTLEWSPEARALLRPGMTFAELIADEERKASFFVRPLLFLFVFGCTVSVVASGRFSIRLIADGAISFAFLPVVEIAALAIVRGVGFRHRSPLGQTVDLFFVGNAPWLLWLALISGLASVVPPQAVVAWSGPVLAATLFPVAWSAYIDLHFFEQVMGRVRRDAVKDLLLHRVLGWSGAMLFFVGPEKLIQRFVELLQEIGL